MKKIILLCFALSFFLFKSATAQDPRTAKLDSLFSGAHLSGVFNGNVLVAENGAVIYKRSFGFADAGKKIKLDDSYRFNIGSIAKEFNAVGLMMLKEKGKITLDDRVSKYIKGLPKWADSISILHLLQYTSGIPNSKWNEITSDSANMEALKKVKQLDFLPGTKYAYNNNNTFLQRQIIQKVSGMPFAVFVKEKMLKPLQMNHSIVDPIEKDEKVARAFNNDLVQDGLTPPISGWTNVTIDDFYKWAKAIANFKLISPSSTKQILYGFAPGNQAGLGGGMMEKDILLAHKHDGTTRNYQALLVTAHAKDRVSLLLTNNQQNNLYQLDRSIQAILEGKPYAKVRKSFLSTFKTQIAKMNGEGLLSFYAEKEQQSPDQFSFESEDSLNEIGYQFLRNNQLQDALVILKENTRRFPQSGNVWDSLAEATLAAGDKQQALIYYTKAYQLDPNNATAKKMMADLK